MRKTQRAPERGVDSKADREVAADLQLLTPPAAISFPSCRKRYGRKGALGCFWCFLPRNLGRNQCFGLAFHTIVTLRASWYAPPDTGVPNLQLVALEYLQSIEGAGRICWSAPFCGEIFLICTHQMPSLEGRCPEGADEGRGAVTVLLKLQSDLQVLPGPHPSAALRSAATFPLDANQ